MIFDIFGKTDENDKETKSYYKVLKSGTDESDPNNWVEMPMTPPKVIMGVSGATGPISTEYLKSLGYPDPPSQEDEDTVLKFYKTHPDLKTDIDAVRKGNAERGLPDRSMQFNPDEPWIQTYTGRRFNPTNPVVEAIVIEDIAHALSMQCRFSGHVRKFYSVAQHCVLVSYICDMKDALHGLLHDASEAYLVDVPSPLKHSGKFNAYIEFEAKMQKAIWQRFGLEDIEPESVRKADKVLLSTEARDLLKSLRSDWEPPTEPLPFKIEALTPQEAKNLFMKRFYELKGYSSEHYQSYLDQENNA